MTLGFLSDLYFLIVWLDDEELMDVLPARDITASNGVELQPGDKCILRK